MTTWDRGLPSIFSLASGVPRPFCRDWYRELLTTQRRGRCSTSIGGTLNPSNRSRAIRIDHGRDLYKGATLSNASSSKTKQFRRIATRYAQTAKAYLSMVQLVAAATWTR